MCQGYKAIEREEGDRCRIFAGFKVILNRIIASSLRYIVYCNEFYGA